MTLILQIFFRFTFTAPLFQMEILSMALLLHLQVSGWVFFVAETTIYYATSLNVLHSHYSQGFIAIFNILLCTSVYLCIHESCVKCLIHWGIAHLNIKMKDGRRSVSEK